MDRLLTDEEIRGIVQNTPAGVYDYKAVAQAQDDLTTHLVATQIFKELEERCPHTPDDAFDWIKRMCPDCFHAIKSKWGIEC